MKKINWKYPIFFSIDLKSTFKSIWFGWWLFTWAESFEDFNCSFQPGL